MVWELGDIELLESYFLLIWSEWNFIWMAGLTGTHTSFKGDFGGIGMWRHREILIKRLDQVLGELDRGLDHLRQQKPSLEEHHIQVASGDYRGLKEGLLEVDREALEILTRTPFRSINFFGLLTPVGTHRIPLDV